MKSKDYKHILNGTNRNFLLFFLINLAAICLSVNLLIGYKPLKILAVDSVSYLYLADALYDKNNINENLQIAYHFFPFYPLLNYVCYLFIGNSYLALQIFYFSIIFISNLFFYLLLKEISPLINPDLTHNNSPKQKDKFLIITSLFLINFVVFCAHSNKFLAENLLLALTLPCIYYTYKAITTTHIYNYLICFIIYIAVSMTKPQGVGIILAISLFALLNKKRTLTLTSLLSLIPILLYYFFITIPKISFSESYGGALLISNWNFKSFFFGLYRLIFCIPYELFFSDILTNRLEVYYKNYGILIYLPKFIISIILWILILYGWIKLYKNNQFYHTFGFSNYIFVISIAGFLLHTSDIPELQIYYYDTRLFIYLWSILVIYLVLFLNHLKSKITIPIIITILIANILLLSKNFILNIKSIKENKWQLNSIRINRAKVGCIGLKEPHLYEKHLISYILFRKICSNISGVSVINTDYDYILDFEKNSELKNYKPVYTYTRWKIEFTVYENETQKSYRKIFSTSTTR